MSKSEDKKATGASANHLERRKVLQGLVASGAIAGATLPNKWKKPIVDTVMLPAHAQTTNLVFGGFLGIDLGGGMLEPIVNSAHAEVGGACVRVEISGSFAEVLVREGRGFGRRNTGSGPIEDDSFSVNCSPANIEVNGTLIRDGSQISHIEGDVDGRDFVLTTEDAEACSQSESCDTNAISAVLGGGQLLVIAQTLVNNACVVHVTDGDDAFAQLIKSDGTTITYQSTSFQDCTDPPFPCMVSVSLDIDTGILTGSDAVNIGDQVTLRHVFPGGCVCTDVVTITGGP